MAKKSKTAKKEKTEKVVKTSKYNVIIDHPQSDEEICHRAHYAIRLGTLNEGIVEISINDTEYQPCRWADGYWWYDWTDLPAGENIIVARLVDPQKNRTLKKSERVTCIVK